MVALDINAVTGIVNDTRSFGRFYPFWETGSFSRWHTRFDRSAAIGCRFGFGLWGARHLFKMPDHAILW